MTRAERFNQQSGLTPRPDISGAATGDRFLVLVEGSETERRYLEDLCGRLSFSAYSVKIQAPDTDPLNLVAEAVKLQSKELARAGEGLTVAYNQVWVVCDRESKFHERRDRLRAACELAEKNGIWVALSAPSFEFWLLLHFRCEKRCLGDCATVESALNEVHSELGLPKYEKAVLPLEPYVTRECVNRACKYSDSVRLHHNSSDTMTPPRYWAKDFVLYPGGASAPDGDPSTDVDQLVRQLNLAANPRFRFVPFSELPDAPFKR